MIFLLLFSLVPVLILQEWVLRKYYKQPDFFQREKNRLLYIPRSSPPKQQIEIQTKRDLYTSLPLRSWIKSSSKTNNVGFVGKDIVAKKKAIEYRVFILCGSQLLGMMLPDEDKFTSVFEKENKNNYQVYLASQIACNSADTLAMLCHKIIQFEPDIVLISVGISQQRLTTEAYQHSKPQTIRTLTWLAIFLSEFALFNWIIKYVMFFREKILINQKEDITAVSLYPTKISPIIYSEQPFVASEDDAECYRRILAAMIGICKENGIKLGFIMQPTSFGNPTLPYVPLSKPIYKPMEVVKMLKFYENVVFSICREKNTPCLTLNEEELPREKRYFTDAIHLSTEGMKIITKKIVQFLDEIKKC